MNENPSFTDFPQDYVLGKAAFQVVDAPHLLS